MICRMKMNRRWEKMESDDLTMLETIEGSIGRGWHFDGCIAKNVYELVKTDPVIGTDRRVVKAVRVGEDGMIPAKKKLRHLNRIRDNANVVSYFDYGSVGDCLWYVMDRYVPLTVRTFDEHDVLKVGLDIAHALEACERSGIIHRDVKPGNVFVKSSAEHHYLLGDFDIALDEDDEGDGHFSIGYSAPELLKRKFSHRSDIYSLGMTLYVLANGCRFPLRRDVLPDIDCISAGLNAALKKACRLKPDDRYQTAAEFRGELMKLMLDIYRND